MTDLLRKSLLLFAVVFSSQLFAQSYQDAMNAMHLSDWNKAQTTLEALTKANPQDQDAWLSLGCVYRIKGQNDMAKSAYESLLASNSDGAKAFVANARLLLMRNDVAEADKQIDKATRAGKKDASVFRHIGESFIYVSPDEKPNYTRGEEFLKKGYEVNTKDYNTLMSLGYTYNDQGNGGDAARFYEYASLREAQNPIPLYLTGKVYAIAKIYPRALEFFDKTIAVAPKFSQAYRAKAEYYFFDAQNYDEAVKAYHDAVTMGDNVTIEDQSQYANTLFLTKDYPNCIDQTQKVMKLDPSKTYLQRLLGYCYYETEDYTKGLGVMNTYFKTAPADKIIPNDYYYKAQLELKTGGDTLDAIKNLQTLIQLDPIRWANYKQIGDLYYSRGEFCNAAIAYGARIDSLKENTQAGDFYYLGITHFFCNDDPQHFTKALAAFDSVSVKVPTSTLGWLWAGKTAAKLDPDLTDTTGIAPEMVKQVMDQRLADFGKAHDYFEKYIELAKVDVNKNRKDLITAYEYMVYFHFVKKEDAESIRFADELLAIDSENETAVSIKEEIKLGEKKNK